MARIKVPERYFEGIAKTLSLTEEVFQELVGALAKLPAKLYPKDLMAKAVSNSKDISAKDAGTITSALLSLCLNRASSDKSTQNYLAEVIQSIEEAGSDTLKLLEKDKETLNNRLGQILDIKPLAVASKATSILFEHDRSFARARVVTDIRPIFDTKADTPPSAAVIIHTLNIHYYQDGEHKEFFVAMDGEDVQMMLNVMERAKVKANSLKQTLASTKITCVDKE